MALKQFADKVRANETSALRSDVETVTTRPHFTETPVAQKLATELPTQQVELKSAALSRVNDAGQSRGVNPLSGKDQEMLCALSAMQIRYGRPAEAIPYLMMVRKVNSENTECIRLLSLAFMRLERWYEASVMVAELNALQNKSNAIKDGMVFLYQAIVSLKTQGVGEARSLFDKFRTFVKGNVQGRAL